MSVFSNVEGGCCMRKRMIAWCMVLCAAIVLVLVAYWSLERIENQEKKGKINNDFVIQNNQSTSSDDTQEEDNKSKKEEKGKSESQKKEISDEITTGNKVETREDDEGNLIFIHAEDNEPFNDENIDNPNSSEKKSDNNQSNNEAIKNNSSDTKADDDTGKKDDNKTENDVVEFPFIPVD